MNEHPFRPKIIVPGCEVFSASGTLIGVVGEVRGDLFKVSVPLQPDYWLPGRTVEYTDQGRVMLRCDLSDLHEFRVQDQYAA
jgi:hypothetical protein